MNQQSERDLQRQDDRHREDGIDRGVDQRGLEVLADVGVDPKMSKKFRLPTKRAVSNPVCVDQSCPHDSQIVNAIGMKTKTAISPAAGASMPKAGKLIRSAMRWPVS